MKRFREKSQREEGAALVEFAVVALLLFTLLFGVIEFGWLLSNVQDVRHGAREGARLAAVNADDSTEMARTTCRSMDFAIAGANQARVEFQDAPGDGTYGSEATVIVEVPVYTSLTGFLDPVILDTIRSEVSIRLEQDSDNWAPASVNCVDVLP